MKFLIKIENAINDFISNLLTKLKGKIPSFVFNVIARITQLPLLFREKIHAVKPKLHLYVAKFIGYNQHYMNLVRGQITSAIIYFRSDKFKQIDKKAILLKPVSYAKSNPLKALSTFLTCIILAGVFMILFQNSKKIISETYNFRKLASADTPEEDLFIEFKNHKFEVKLGGGHGGGHGAASEESHNEYELYLDVKIEAKSLKEKKLMEHMEEMLEDNIEALELAVNQLPLTPENRQKIEISMIKSLNEDFMQTNQIAPIKDIKLKQILPGRPVYYNQTQRLKSITDINLQIFLEDTRRNHQIWLDFTMLSSNRNVILYLNEHDAELKDHLNSNVEPVIPQLPIEDEGRLIIKEKIKSEINEFLKKNKIEGKILEIYVDYLMVT